MQDIPDGSVDMILCDLPYGTTRCKWDTVIQFKPLWEAYKRISKRNAAIVLFGAEPFTSSLIMSNPQMFRYDLVWQKEQGSDFLNTNRKPLRAHENIAVFYRAQPTYNKQLREGKPYKAIQSEKNSALWNTFKTGLCTDNTGTRVPVSVLKFDRERGFHQTQKPVALLEWLIRTYTNEGETVLDNCMGSGSTCVAAANTGRRYIGIEKDPEYFEIARKRLEALQCT